MGKVTNSPKDRDDIYNQLYDYAKRSEYGSNSGLGMSEDSAKRWVEKMMEIELDVEKVINRYKELYNFAKESEYSSEPGLGMYGSDAKDWATKWMNKEIDTEIIKKRFKELFDFAKRSETDSEPGLGMYGSDAKDWAKKWMNNRHDIDSIRKRYKELYDFAKRSKTSFKPGLGMNSRDARDWARKWMCSELDIEIIKNRYKELYDFAERTKTDSEPGLNLIGSDAQYWATQAMGENLNKDNLREYQMAFGFARNVLDLSIDKASKWAIEKYNMEPEKIKNLITTEKYKTYWKAFWDNSSFGILLGSIAGLLMSLFLLMRSSNSLVWRKLGFWFFFTFGEIVLFGCGIVFIMGITEKIRERAEKHGIALSTLLTTIIWIALATTIFPSLRHAFISVLVAVIRI